MLRFIQVLINLIFFNKKNGFWPLRSTIICNFKFFNYIMNSLRMYSQVDIIYTNFTKTFVQVDHSILLNIVREFEFSEHLLV